MKQSCNSEEGAESNEKSKGEASDPFTSPFSFRGSGTQGKIALKSKCRVLTGNVLESLWKSIVRENQSPPT